MLKQALVLSYGSVRCAGEEKKCNVNLIWTASASSKYQGNYDVVFIFFEVFGKSRKY